MGNEMSCPCVSNTFNETPNKGKEDIDELIAKRFTKDDLIFSYEFKNTKLVIVPTEKLESFLKIKNSIKYNLKKEVKFISEKLNIPYNRITMSNCLNKFELTIIIFEYVDNQINTLNDEFAKSNEAYVYSLKLSRLNETILNIRVNDFNIVSSEIIKILDLIHMNINNMLKTDYIFMGVVNLSRKNLREYKLVFKKILKYDNQFHYEILSYEGNLSKSLIDQYLRENNDKKLKSVITFYKYKNQVEKGKVYFFIFEKNLTINKSYDHLLFEYPKKMSPDTVYFEDVVKKLNFIQNQDASNVEYNYRLSCLINDEDNLYFVLYEEQTQTFSESEID